MPEDPVTHLYRSATRRGWYAMAAMVNAGTTLNWVCQVLLASWAELYATAATAPKPDDPIFLPHLGGERTPYLDPGLRGSWTGIAPHHSREHLLRAALEGVAFSIRTGLHALLDTAAIDHIRIAGGGTTQPTWRQMLADILDVPLRAADVASASGRGAALIAAQAARLINEDDALALVSRDTVGPSIDPRPDHIEHYAQRYHSYLSRLHALQASSRGERP